MNFVRTSMMLSLAGLLSVAANHADARNKKFSCPMPNGTTCLSAEGVYEATNDSDDLVEREPAPKAKRGKVEPAVVYVPAPAPAVVVPVGGVQVPTPDRCCDPVITAVTVKGDTLAVASPESGFTGATNAPAVSGPIAGTVTVTAPFVGTPGTGGEMVVRSARNEAFREPARVMRIFVTPWEDEVGDLHLGGFLLTEIEPRRWTVGARAPTGDNTFRLLGNSPARETAHEAKTEAGAATPATGRPEGNVAQTSNSLEKQQ